MLIDQRMIVAYIDEVRIKLGNLLKILFYKPSSLNLMCLVVKKTYDSKLGFDLLKKIKSKVDFRDVEDIFDDLTA